MTPMTDVIRALDLSDRSIDRAMECLDNAMRCVADGNARLAEQWLVRAAEWKKLAVSAAPRWEP
jgi:hypothetical protein